MNGWGESIAMRLPLIDRKRTLAVFFVMLLAMVVAVGLTVPAHAAAIDQWLQVDGGDGHTVAIAQDGSLWAWGHNNFGQLGDGTTTDSWVPVQISTATWAKVSAGMAHSLAIRSDGTLWAWGYNSNGQVGDGSTSNRLTPYQVSGFTDWSEVSAGGLHSAAIRSNGWLYTWGCDDDGQLGNASPTGNVLTPTRIGTETIWSKVAAGPLDTFGIKNTGVMWAVGRGLGGRLGRGNGQSFSDLTNANANVAGGPWSAVSPGMDHTLAIKTDGTLWVWGGDGLGQRGDGASDSGALTKSQIGAATTWTSVAAGNYHSMALNSAGQIWVAGDNSSGQLGMPYPPNTQPVFMVMGSDTDWDRIATGGSHSFGIKIDGSLWGTLWSWGDNAWGQLGDGTNVDEWRPLITSTPSGNSSPDAVDDPVSTPEDTALDVHVRDNDVDVDGDAYLDPTSILTSPPGSGIAVLSGDGTYYTYTPTENWNGTATFGYSLLDAIWEDTALVTIDVSAANDAPVAADDQATTSADTATNIDVVANDTDIEGSSLSPTNVSDPAHGTTTVNPDGTVHYVPDGDWHGIDTFTYTANDGGLDSVSPATVAVSVTATGGSIDQWLAVDGGDGHTVAIAQDGTLWAWGHNNFGQLGDGTTVDSWVPKQVSTDTWTKVSAGGGHTLAIRSDGTLWAWGYNSNGQVGNNSNVNQLTPVQIGTATDWTDASAGTFHSMGIRSGTMWGWGKTRESSSSSNDNRTGLGTNFTDPKVPTQVGTDTTWVSVSAGYAHTMAIKTGNTLWATGLASSGQLGRGNGSSATQFAQVLSAPSGYPDTYRMVSAGSLHTLAIDTNGNLWTWGENALGQRGDGTGVNGGAPYTHQHIGTATNWVSVAAGLNHSMALNSAGQIWVAGDNSSGQLGMALPPNKQLAFVQMSSSIVWDKIAAGGNHSFGIDQNGYLWGSLWAWGDDTWGQLGDGGTLDDWFPFQVVTPYTNVAPIAADDAYSTDEDVVLTVAAPGVLGNDTDLDGGTISAVLVAGTTHGVLVLNADGSFTYDPAANYCGPDSFTYKANDTVADSNVATVNITVNAVNDATGARRRRRQGHRGGRHARLHALRL